MPTGIKGKAVDAYWRWQLSGVAKAISRARLTYLNAAKLYNLEWGLRRIEASGIQGNCLEFGVALGGSAILIASQMGAQRCFAGYDLFGTIPPPSERDDEKEHERYRVIKSGQATGLGDDPYYGYETDLISKVKRNFADFGLMVDDRRIRLVPGLFQDTVPLLGESRIALAHIDCDWFDGVSLCLEHTYGSLSNGGIVILDDYNFYGGCRRATEAFLATHQDMRLIDTRYSAIVLKQ